MFSYHKGDKILDSKIQQTFKFSSEVCFFTVILVKIKTIPPILLFCLDVIHIISIFTPNLVNQLTNLSKSMSKKINGELGFLLNKGTQALHREINRKFNARNLDITFEQVKMLFFLFHCNAKSQNEIAEKTYKDKVSIKKLIDNLEKRDLVYRAEDETDKRIKKVYITEKGKKLIPELRKLTKDALDVGFYGVPDKDIQIFKKVLSVLVKNFTGEDLLKFINTNKERWN